MPAFVYYKRIWHSGLPRAAGTIEGMLIGFDIETDTSQTEPGGARSGLDPRYSRVISAAAWADNGHEYFARSSEALLLGDIAQYMGDVGKEDGTLLTWNGANFDLPFLVSRAWENSVKLGLVWQVSSNRPAKYRHCPGFDGGLVARWGELDHVDVSYAYREYAEAQGLEWRLKPVAKSFGLEPVEVDSTATSDLSPAELEVYNLSDVRITHGLGSRIDLDLWRDSLELAG